METKNIKIIILWISFWLLVTGVLSLYLKGLGIDYNNNSIFVFGYFIVAGFLGVYFFKVSENVFPEYLKFDLKYFIILIFLGISPVIIELCNPLEIGKINQFQDLGILFPLFNYGTTLAKFGDILFQQFMIIAFISLFKKEGYSKTKNIKLFSICFSILHLPLLYIFGIHGLLFIIPAFFGGVGFSFLILYSERGVFKSLFLHMAFYLGLGLILRYFI